MPKFSIRDLLWLMLVVGVAVGWWVDHRTMVGQYARRSGYIERLKSELRWKIGESEALKWEELTKRAHIKITAGVLPPDLENEP